MTQVHRRPTLLAALGQSAPACVAYGHMAIFMQLTGFQDGGYSLRAQAWSRRTCWAEAATAKPALVTEVAPPHAYADQTTCEESVQEQEAPNTTLILLHGVYFQKKSCYME